MAKTTKDEAMGYWKSVAAEVLPSWLKNLRAKRRGGATRIGETSTEQTTAGAQTAAKPHVGGLVPAAAPSKASAPGTTAPKTR